MKLVFILLSYLVIKSKSETEIASPIPPVNTLYKLYKLWQSIFTHNETLWAAYVLNIDLQRSFVMVKVLGKLIALVIEGKDGLEEGQHLQESKTMPSFANQKIKNTLQHMRRILSPDKLSRQSLKIPHRLDTLKLLPLLDLLQLANIVQWLLLKVVSHGFHLDVCLRRTRAERIQKQIEWKRETWSLSNIGPGLSHRIRRCLCVARQPNMINKYLIQ